MNRKERFFAGTAVTVVTVVSFGVFVWAQERGGSQNQEKPPASARGFPDSYFAQTPTPFPTETPIPTSISESTSSKTLFPTPTVLPIPTETPVSKPTPTPTPRAPIANPEDSEDEEGDFVGSGAGSEKFSFPLSSIRKELAGWTEVKNKRLFDNSVFEFGKEFRKDPPVSAQIKGRWVNEWDPKKESVSKYTDRMLGNIQQSSYAFLMHPPEIQVPEGVSILLNLERSGPEATGTDTLRYTAAFLVKSNMIVVSVRLTSPKNPQEKELYLKPVLAALQAVISQTQAGA